MLTGIQLDNSVRAEGHAAVGVAGRRFSALIASLARIDDPVPTEALGRDREILKPIDDAGRASGARGNAHASLREGLPDQALVGARIRVDVGLQDGVASIEERWAAGLQLQSIHDQLHCQVVAPGPGVKIGVVSVGIDQIPVHVPKRNGPYGADSMRDRSSLDVVVGVWIDCEVC